jgi:Holliday junction resolvasome RuvABC endonuclease subunit
MSTKVFGVPNLKGGSYVGIDQSYSGFAITAIDASDNYYTEVKKLDGIGVERLHKARAFLLGFLDTFHVEAIAIEGYAFGSQMANMAGELGGMIRLALFDKYRFQTEEAAFPLVVPPTSLKKYITGKGRVDKNQVLLQVYKKWGVEFTDDNAADSYGLARIARNCHDFEYEIEVYEKLTYPRK